MLRSGCHEIASRKEEHFPVPLLMPKEESAGALEFESGIIQEGKTTCTQGTFALKFGGLTLIVPYRSRTREIGLEEWMWSLQRCV